MYKKGIGLLIWGIRNSSRRYSLSSSSVQVFKHSSSFLLHVSSSFIHWSNSTTFICKHVCVRVLSCYMPFHTTFVITFKKQSNHHRQIVDLQGIHFHCLHSRTCNYFLSRLIHQPRFNWGKTLSTTLFPFFFVCRLQVSGGNCSGRRILFVSRILWQTMYTPAMVLTNFLLICREDSYESN